ncbi:MAG: aminotransferase class V-fold PLP-dependent enzyme [Bryobacteraceae bacterium]|nr:aminotransferase class V-fold PLP-dependent enzyme [Bryobacteraceae bacterium]
MELNRRNFLRTAPALAGGAVSAACGSSTANSSPAGWDEVRSEFGVSDEVVDFTAMLIASHPRPVREAIERHRRALDENPAVYLESELNRQEERVLEAAAQYLGARADDIALTDSTTMGLGLVYQGFHLQPEQEFLVSEHNYYSTRESIRLAAARSGASVRTFSLYSDIANVTAGELVDNVVSAVRPATRVIALTWVHSSTGLKLPVERIAEALSEVNRRRDESDRALLCVDGVHGFGVEDVETANLGCDFFVAGCHKWLFGPRGTGIIWGSRRGWGAVSPVIPTFRDNAVRRAWIRGEDPDGETNGARMSPGGFKPYEHQWALAEAFEFHQNIGKSRIAARTHELSRQTKEGLAAMPHVTLYTPMPDELSAGIVCFDVNGKSQREVVASLRKKQIIATATPYQPSYARLTPSIRNSPEEIETALREIRALG